MTNLIKKFQLFCIMLVTSTALLMTSCEQSELISTESFSDNAIQSMQEGAIGKGFCLELIFPLTIEFADETTAEVTSYENLHETIVAFFEESGLEKNRQNKPQLVFPIQVLNEDAEIIDIETKDELRELRKECPRTGKCKGRKGKGFKCFSTVFPLTLSFEGTESTFDSKEELRDAIKEYKEEAGPDAERPTIVFPVTVEYEDGTQVTVSSKEELQELKEDCKND